MKKLAVIIVSVFAVNTINAQHNDVASIEVNNEIEFVKSNLKPNTINKEKLSYSESIKNFKEAITIKDLENAIAAYNLKKDAIYDNSERARYNVSFNRKNAKAAVVYNTDGEIINTEEKYKNVKLPYQLAASIAKKHPKFYTKNTTVFKKFNKGFGIKTIYEVEISNGTKTKTLKIVN